MADRVFETAQILVVDDEPVTLRLLERLLKGAGYSNVLSSLDAGGAVSLIESRPPDLVVLDLHLLHIDDGIALLTGIVDRTSKDAYLPVLVVTADGTSVAVQRALSAGAKDFLTKPFRTDELLLRIRNLLVTDVVMPEMSGAELARRLAAVRPSLPVLFMSGYTDDVMARQGFSKAAPRSSTSRSIRATCSRKSDRSSMARRLGAEGEGPFDSRSATP